jgi:hypothetical protein
MAADLLKFEHHLSQFFIFTFFSSSFMGDGPILTEDTAEVAVGEEEGGRTMLTHQGYFLAKMGMGAEDDDLQRSLAEPSLTLFTVHSAASGTEVTILKDGVSLFNPLGQLPLSLQFLVGRNPWVFFFWNGKGRGGGEKQGTTEEKRMSYEVPAGESHVAILLKDHRSFNFLPG